MKRLFLLLITLFLLFTFACNKNTGNTPIDLETINNEKTQVLDNNQNKTEKNVKTETELTEKTEPVEKTEIEVTPIVPTETIVEEIKYNITIRSFNNELILQTTNSLTQEIIDESGYNDVIYLNNLYYDELFTIKYDGKTFTDDEVLYLKIDNIYDYNYFIDNNYFDDFVCFSVMNANELLASVLLSEEDKEDFKKTFSDYFNTLKDVFVVYVAHTNTNSVLNSEEIRCLERIVIKNVFDDDVKGYISSYNYRFELIKYKANIDCNLKFEELGSFSTQWITMKSIVLFNCDTVYSYKANELLINGLNFKPVDDGFEFDLIYENELYILNDDIGVDFNDVKTYDEIVDLYSALNLNNFKYISKYNMYSSSYAFSHYNINNEEEFKIKVKEFLDSYCFVSLDGLIEKYDESILKLYGAKPVSNNESYPVIFANRIEENEETIDVKITFNYNYYGITIEISHYDISLNITSHNTYCSISQSNYGKIIELLDAYCILGEKSHSCFGIN